MNKLAKSLALAALTSTALVAGCSDADVVSENLSKDADNFKVERRIVFFNGITDRYLLTIEGRCSIKPNGGKLDVTCAVGGGKYKKHFLGLSDNVSYFVEQIDGASVSKNHYKVVFKPSVIVPDIEVR